MTTLPAAECRQVSASEPELTLDDHETEMEGHIHSILQLIGEDPDREGLVETPRRVRQAWAEWTKGYSMDPTAVLKSFEHAGSRPGEVVLVTDIPVYSMCEHHLAPFFGVAHIAYTPTERIVGLSKLSRLVTVFERRLQVQERLTNQIADALLEGLQPSGVAVLMQCRHMCMESRGIRTRGTQTLTSAYRGTYDTDGGLRSEFYSLVGFSNTPPASNGHHAQAYGR